MVNVPAKDGEELIWAVQNGDLQSVKSSLSKLPDVNSHLKDNGRSLLHYAADYGQIEICKLLIDKGAEINRPDNYGVTPLLAAIYEGHITCAKFLLENGAKIGSAPDGSSYMEIAQSDELKQVLHQYAAV